MGLGRGSPPPSPRVASSPDPGGPRRSRGGGGKRGAAGPPPGRGSRLARPPRRRRYLAGGRPLGECFQQGPPLCGGDLRRQQQQQHEQERRRGHHSGGEHATAGSRGPGKKPPLTRRWPGPQAEPASRCPRPTGARAGASGYLYFSLWVFLPIPTPPQPHSLPPPLARCWAPQFLNNALPFRLPQPFPAISPAQPCETEAEHLEQR